MKLLKISLILTACLLVVILSRAAPTLHLGLEITEVNNQICKAEPSAPGAEDISILKSQDLALFATDERRQYLSQGLNVAKNGALWSLDLSDQNSSPIEIQTDFKGEFHPHGVSLFTDNEQNNFLYVINHVTTTNHEIDVFQLTSSNQAKFVTKHSFPELTSPNDIHVVDHHTFFVTNDHNSPRNTVGEKVEDLLRLPVSNVVFYNGSSAKIVVDDLYMANGITLNSDQSLMYVAESTAGQISEYTKTESGRWSHTKSVAVQFMPDNLEWDDEGNLLTAGHPKSFDFMLHMLDPENLAPSEVARINMNTGEVETLYRDLGDDLSGSSVAAVHDDTMLVGSVFESHLMRCNLLAQN